MNLFANVVTEALGELTPSQFSSSIDADDSFDKRTTVKKISRFKSSRCLRKFLQQYPTEKEELYFPPHCCHSEVSDYASAVENGSMASYPLSQGCDNNDNWNNSEQDTSSQMTETPATPSTTTATAQSEGPATSTPQRPISHHASSDDLRTGAIANNVHQDCSVKGYEVIRLIARGTSYKFSKIFLANNRNNTAISPVEIVAYTQPYTYFLTSCYCNDSKASNRHPMLNRALDLPPHRNLVTLLHRFCSPLMVYQVAEHFPWPSLTDLISTTSPGWVGNCRRGLAEDTRRSIFKQICGGMEHLHLCGIVHGGLNCDNILVSDRLEVKLANYGPACQRLSMSYDPIRDRMSPRITPYDAYTPPEMMTVSGSWTRSCDVWCIGVVLLEMTLGEIPPSLNAAIRLSGSAKKVERVGLETCGYQLSLLIDKILQCRPSQRPHVSTLSQHAWLSDGTEMVVVVNKGSVKVSKRTDGSTFPLPKRLQNQMLPTSDAFYDNSDAESEAKNAPSDRTGGYSGGCQGETGDSRVAVTSSWNEKSSHSDVSASDDRHCMHSVSCNHCQPRPEGEKVGGGGESEIVEHRSYSKVLTLEEEFFGRLMTESSENKGFLSNLVESLDTMSNSGVTGYGDNRSGVPKHRRRANSHRLKEVNTHKNRTKRAKLTRRYSPPTTYLDYLSEFKTSPSQRDDRDGKGATWTGLYNKYLDSEYSASTSSHNDHEDSSTVFTFTDCSNEFVMEDDDKALEEIESMIRQEEKEFWGREYGRITVETK
ncbi:hypothetical protein Btru_004012 [Bulinus truncatus]|nr:hypothetical protein Btru_004012 [Bulinus truncatus]